MAGKTLSIRTKAEEPATESAAEEAAEAEATPKKTVTRKAPAKTAAKAPAGKTAAGKGQNLQDIFLNHLRKQKTPVTMFLVKGVKLQGIVTWFDNFSILLRRDGQTQLVYKHAISTIMPTQPVDAALFEFSEEAKGKRMLQDVFLSSVRDAGAQVTMFLINGVMLQGRIAAYDLFCMLLEREGYVQLAYKHAISTVQPITHVDLSGDWAGDE
ncbi:RNA chaperone Hfq [Croceicoccus sp. Ery5]|uniref:RNA chaperone Hfq n=1 Tax=Croceicoccus sp. Ery5 TaxID=1703340 RepID=UPI001E29C207|nr:RNA chaperone Hfq [Croceicoccus sp. Ery5]